MKGSTAAAKQTMAAIQAEADAPAAKTETEKMTFLLPVELAAELRAASIDVTPRVFGVTLSALVTRAVQKELESLRGDWNEGEPFTSSEPVQTRKGRPKKI